MKTIKVKKNKQKFKDFSYNNTQAKELRRIRRMTNQFYKKRRELLKK